MKLPVDWHEKPLGDVFTKIVVGYVGNVNDFYCAEGDGVPFYRTLNIRDGYFRHDGIRYVTKEFNEKNKKSQIQNGDILIARVGANLGMVCKVTGIGGMANIANAIIIKGVSGKKASSDFYSYFLLSSYGKTQIYAGAVGGAQGVFNTKLAQGISVPVPPLVEQKKISEILSVWDKAITTTEQLLANSQQQKKALMQQLLTGKIRFAEFVRSNTFAINRYGLIPVDWEFVSLEKVAKGVSEKNKSDENYPVLSCSKYHGFVESLKYFNKQVYSDDISGYKIIRRGEFGFPSNHVEEGSIGLQNLYDVGLVSPIYIIFKADQKKIDNAYLYSLLKTDHYKQIFSASTNASVDRRGNLRWDEFGKIKIPVPSLAEQRKISSALSIADKEIEVIQAKLNVLRQEKKSLMQQLLTGKRRVSIN